MAYNNVGRDPSAFRLDTMKPPEVKTDIQKAVKDYVDSLIQERSGPGRGMAASSHDLMLAARAASIKVNTRDVSQTYLKPALQVIAQHKPNPPDNARKPLPKRTQATKTTTKREPHWLTWKTGRTPDPSIRAATPARPDTSLTRPDTSLSVRRQESPDIEILALDTQPIERLQTPAPTNFINRLQTPYRAQTPGQRAQTPAQRAQTPAQRTQTPAQKFRIATPASMKPDHRDPLADRQVAPADLVLRPNTPQNPAYMPALKAWINNANDYERDVAFNLMQVLNTGGAPVALDRGRPRTAVPGMKVLRNNNKRNIPKTAGVRTTIPAYWQQVYHDPGHEQFVVNNMARALTRKEPVRRAATSHEMNPRERYTQITRPPLVVNDSGHFASHFMDAQKPYRGSFTINPEWTSEFCPPPRVYRSVKNTEKTISV